MEYTPLEWNHDSGRWHIPPGVCVCVRTHMHMHACLSVCICVCNGGILLWEFVSEC